MKIEGRTIELHQVINIRVNMTEVLKPIIRVVYIVIDELVT